MLHHGRGGIAVSSSGQLRDLAADDRRLHLVSRRQGPDSAEITNGPAPVVAQIAQSLLPSQGGNATLRASRAVAPCPAPGEPALGALLRVVRPGSVPFARTEPRCRIT